MPGRAGRLARRLFTDLRREYPGPTRDAVAIGVGAFIGCQPLFGFHLPLTILVGRVLRLNRLKMYVAANISNPLIAPALLFVELQTGAWLRRRDLYDVTVEAIQQVDLGSAGADLMIGSLAVGALIGTSVTLLTLAAVRPRRLPPHLDAIFTAASDRYVDTTVTAWEFARGKLRGDPVYATLVTDPLPPGHTFVDIGCGQGLALATMVEAAGLYASGQWPPDAPPPPVFDKWFGIELRKRVAAIAREALGNDVEITHATAPAGLPADISAAALFDVLHLMSYEDQELLLDGVAARMPAGGVLLVREANADAEKGFRQVRIGNRIKAIAVGRWKQRFYFRGLAAWEKLFSSRGWQVQAASTSNAAGFANVLFRLTRARSASLDD
jgi:uncharacterized protein (DUF2062 family)/SAM-dependent methyltransferase